MSLEMNSLGNSTKKLRKYGFQREELLRNPDRGDVQRQASDWADASQLAHEELILLALKEEISDLAITLSEYNENLAVEH